MIKFIAAIVIVTIAGLLLFAATKPDSFRIERSANINASPEKIFALITDFHTWTQWSPWENIDPNLKRSYAGPASGNGAVYAWTGNNDIGAGRMEILNTTSPSNVVIQLDFFKPFKAHNTAEFNLKRNGSMTEVTWAMYGPSPYLSKIMSLFFSMDKMIGGNFETGLANLKTIAERNE